MKILTMLGVNVNSDKNNISEERGWKILPLLWSKGDVRRS